MSIWFRWRGAAFSLSAKVRPEKLQMRTAITQGLAVTVLTVCLSASQNGPAQSEEKPEAGRGTSAPKPQARPDAAPKRLLPQPRPLQEGAPAAREEAPGALQGCPDPGRTLELIV